MTPSLSIPKTFANNFWGKEDAGYNVLMHKMNMAKKTCDDLKSFYNTKASLHEDLAKKLLKQTKTELGREETGTLGMLLASTQKQMESSAQAHQELARKIRVELELPLDNFILEQKDKRKLYQTNVDKAHRNKNLHASHVNKAKEKYEAECAKKVSLEHQIASATGSKDMDRLQFKVERSKNEIRTLDKEYKDACAKLTDATALWNHEWKIACDRFQEMEEKRVEFLHHSMCIYINILSTTSGQEQESYEQFWKALDVCDPKTDVEKFIDEKGTGNMIPEPPVYVNYFDDPAKTLPRYQVAQFPAGNDEILSTAPLPQTPAITSSKTTTARRTASYCEPQRRSSQHHQQQQQQPKELPKAVEERKVHLYASGSCRGREYKKPAPASRSQDVDNVDDECIDPRAQVVMAIGNNRFQVDHQQPPASHQQRPKPRRRRTMRTSLDMEEAFNDSIRGLLQELGVQRKQATATIEQEEYHHHPPSQHQQQQEQEQEQQQVIWARALYDYHSDHPDDLSIKRGTWLAIVQNDHKDWWVAHKWDESINALQETCGYVASSFVQVVP